MSRDCSTRSNQKTDVGPSCVGGCLSCHHRCRLAQRQPQSNAELLCHHQGPLGLPPPLFTLPTPAVPDLCPIPTVLSCGERCVNGASSMWRFEFGPSPHTTMLSRAIPALHSTVHSSSLPRDSPWCGQTPGSRAVTLPKGIQVVPGLGHRRESRHEPPCIDFFVDVSFHSTGMNAQEGNCWV